MSWIRRFLYTNTKWYRLLETICNGKLDNIFKLGPEYISELTDNLNNKFWLDVFNSWNFFTHKTTPLSDRDILNAQIWYNRDMIDNKISKRMQRYLSYSCQK